MSIALVSIVLGLAILIYGWDILIKGAGSLSKKAWIPPIVIGLTIVAFGTSAPELIVNINAALKGSTEIAIGNIVGSNIVNILFILGISAMIKTLRVQKSTVWKEIPFAVLAVLVVVFLANDTWLGNGWANVLSIGDWLVLIGFFLIFLYYIFGLAKTSPFPEETESIEIYGRGKSFVYIVGGLVGLFLGGKIFVEWAIEIARIAKLSETLIGLTIVAIGTSLPELATSIIAAKRGQADLAVWNIVGSNIFNIFWILGFTALLRPLPFEAAMNVDLLVCLGSSLLLFVFLFWRTSHSLRRWHGVGFLCAYLLYTAFLLFRG